VKETPPCIHWIEAVWAPEPIWTWWQRDKSLACQESNPSFQPIAESLHD